MIINRTRLAAATILLAASAAALVAGPNRYGHSDRVERHMLPPVSTGPMDPAWSPDGRWIAVSMRGDIWKVPSEGGTAIALTQGPAYHFEPAWSPDGDRIALTMDVEGNLDIGIVGADGGGVERVTAHEAVDVEPEWSRDGRSLFFVSARAGGFRIFRRDLETGADTVVVSGIQPAVSPDGTLLAYVASVRGRLGTGGIWVKELPDGEERLVHYEESEYRMKPAWTPDGSALLYVSDEMGSNDIRIVPASGGNPNQLTVDGQGEFSPSPSPDGSRFTFVSNRTGPKVLYTAGTGGGPLDSWDEVRIQNRASRTPSGRVRIRVTGPDGAPMPSRIQLLASDGRAYAPDGNYHRVISVTETHYFHTGGESEVEVPAGPVEIEAVRGFEYRPGTATIDVRAGETATAEIRLERLVDLPAMGWYSGDTHLHDLHQGRFGLTHEQFFLQLVAEDLHVSNPLIHMDGTRLMGRWEDLTGEPHPLSTADHLFQYGTEFRGSLGHIAMIGHQDYILPFIGGAGSTTYAQPELDLSYVDRARDQGGLAGFPHPYLGQTSTPAGVASTLIPLDVALGRGDYYDLGAMYSDEMNSTAVYYRLLNCGFRIAATGGTDNFSDVWRDPPPGGDRTYVHIEGPLSVEAWLDGVKRQRTFMSTGPILFLDVAGREPGEEITLDAGGPEALTVLAEATSIAPMDQLEIIVNGHVAQTVEAVDPHHLVFEGDIPVPEGGWIAARVLGPSSRYVTDSYAFAHTSPVYVVRGGRVFRSAEDARFLAEAVDAAWQRADRGPWRSEEERIRFKDAVDEALAVYRNMFQ
jgi:TolB protein